MADDYYDVKIEYDIVPLTIESAISFGVGRKKLLNAIRYLERMYGEQELDAVELMRESYKMGSD